MRVQGIASEEAGEAVQFYETGLTIGKVVEQIGYSYGTIRSALHESNVVMRAGSKWKHEASEQRS